MRNPVPRIAAIHDMSGFGRTSLTVAIPILSCMGIQVCPMPTAVLSTHTVEFTDYTLCDLTPELGGILDHWERLGLHFDGVYSGFMASPEQMDSAARCIRNCLAPGGLAVVDPVLGDNGILDPTMTPEMVEKMRWLISCADIITPNITEVALLLDEPFTPRISPEEIKGRLRRLSAMGPQTVVATSVPLLEGGRDPGQNTSVIAYERDEDRFWRIDCAYIPAHYPGTGDTFSSVLTGSLIQGDSLSIALDRASSSPSASGPRSGKGCPRAKASCWSVSSAACSRPSRPANAGSWTGTAAVTRCSPSKTDMGSASQRRKIKIADGGTPRTRTLHPIQRHGTKDMLMTTEQCGQDQLPIGLFDSGVGGLTVLDAMRRLMPGEDYLFLGDTARVPYGAKSQKTIVRYSLQAAAKLIGQRIKLLVIACNTATAAALPALRETWPDMPIIGVIEPGSRAACEASPSGDIAVIATESTIRSGAYAEAILRRRPEAQVRSLACPLFVPLAEEGWFDGPIAEGVVSRYLEPLFEKSPAPDCLVLGCTHYPMLAAAIRKVVGPEVHIVDSAATTAEVVKRRLADKGLAHPQAGRTGRIRFFITDDPQRFTRTGSLFLNMTITDSDVRLVDLENVPLPDAAETPTQRKSS